MLTETVHGVVVALTLLPQTLPLPSQPIRVLTLLPLRQA